jgi:hypothetical protein
MALRGTQHYSAAGRRACNKQSCSCNSRRAWRVASAPVRNAIMRRDNKVEDQLVPSGTRANEDYVRGTAALRNAHRKASGRDRSGAVERQRCR